MLRRFNQALDNGLSKIVFDHIRNLLMCAFLLAIGTHELRSESTFLFTAVRVQWSGIGVIILASLFILLNLYDGIRRLSSSRYHRAFIAILVLLYLFLSLRVVEIAWTFRTVG